ncbi:phosphoribosyltransferase [Streptomyces tateyamensis]|uniref:Phosphoribosyltransferase n=1 Tax=Streptomyces tateyamensis TaxID=565073 RepID=A0A2V4NXJ9_9ACTN|nr:phosphoribosyltransferase family protein [Streptomyces tateyamensis]PYC66472.1 phosphoribosyltransferase [Streptomyces tateyamensis]
MLAPLLDLVLPAPCAGCAEPGGPLCPGCRARLARLAARRLDPHPAPPGLPPVHACAEYQDPLRQLLLAHKERGVLALAAPLGELLARAVLAALPGRPGAGGPPLLLVPMPSTRHAVRARGHDATRRLARSAARRLRGHGLRCQVAPVLRPARRVADQAGLSAAERRANLHRALTVPPRLHRPLTGRQLLLVDDVVTTGATLAEAARALRAAGAPPLAAATVAAAGRG